MTDHHRTPSSGTLCPEYGTPQITPQTTGAGTPAPTPAASTAAPTRAAARAAADAVLGRPTRPTRPWFRKKRLALPSAGILLFGIIIVTTGGNESGIVRSLPYTAELAGTSPTKAAPATATIGQSVRDGTFSFVVTSLQPPSKSFTNRFGTTEKAQGSFVTVRVNVTNIGYEARTLTPTNLFLVDSQGRRFAASSAILTLRGAEQIFLRKINPGHTVDNAPVLFDVAPQTAIANIELHDSVSSTGVKVRLP